MCIWSIEAKLSGCVRVVFETVRQVLLMGAAKSCCCDLESRLKAGVVLGKHRATIISIGARIVIMVEITNATECTTTTAMG